MKTLKEAIQKRDGLSEENALQIIDDMVEAVVLGKDPEEVLEDEGFEPDYVLDLLSYAKGL